MSTFEPRTVRDIDGDHGMVSVYTDDFDGESVVRLGLESSLHLDGPSARKLAQALLDAADALPLRDGWYAYTVEDRRSAIRVHHGECLSPNVRLSYCPGPDWAMAYLAPLTDEDIAQIESEQ